tara:strand:+ start:83695 stop:83844 length:150 start_codon:yes stop_codon:yes gene_type:complete
MIINFIFKFCVEAELPVSISQRSYKRSLKSLANSGDFRAGMNKPEELAG